MRKRGISTRVGTWTGVTVVAVAAGLALAGDASSDPISGNAAGAGRIAVSTGLLTFRPGRAVRLNVVEVDGNRPPRQVRLSIIDGERRVLRQTIALLTPTRPVFLDLPKREVPPPGGDPDPLPIRAEFEFSCDGTSDSGPITTLEVLDTASFAVEATSACGCPCCGPTLPPGVATDCGGGQRVVHLASVP
jgi:hypothetical protein